jgi:hypothetical protein
MFNLPRLPLLYKYHEFYNTLYYISSFPNPGLSYRSLNIEPSNTNMYITGTLNKGQPLNRGKGRKRGGGVRVENEEGVLRVKNKTGNRINSGK